MIEQPTRLNHHKRSRRLLALANASVILQPWGQITGGQYLTFERGENRRVSELCRDYERTATRDGPLRWGIDACAAGKRVQCTHITLTASGTRASRSPSCGPAARAHTSHQTRDIRGAHRPACSSRR
jgi:hypothetical protein